MPEGWQLTPKRKYFLRKRMACGVTLLLCQGQLPLCQLRNSLSLVHFHFNPLIMIKQTFLGSQAGPLRHIPCSGRWGADRKPPWLNKPQLMPACHFFTSVSWSLVCISGQDQLAGNSHSAGCWTRPWRHGLNHQHLTKHSCSLRWTDTAVQGADLVWPRCCSISGERYQPQQEHSVQGQKQRAACSPCSNCSSLSAKGRRGTDAHLPLVTPTVLWLALLTILLFRQKCLDWILWCLKYKLRRDR